MPKDCDALCSFAAGGALVLGVMTERYLGHGNGWATVLIMLGMLQVLVGIVLLLEARR